METNQLFERILFDIDTLLIKEDLPQHLKNNLKYVKKEIDITFKNYTNFQDLSR